MKISFYAVAKGRKPGVYMTWLGPNGAKHQVDGFTGAMHQRFNSLMDAESWIAEVNGTAKLEIPSVLREYTPEELASIRFATCIMLQPHGKSSEHISLLGTNIYEVDTEDFARERALAEFWTPALDAQGVPVVETHKMLGPSSSLKDLEALLCESGSKKP